MVRRSLIKGCTHFLKFIHLYNIIQNLRGIVYKSISNTSKKTRNPSTMRKKSPFTFPPPKKKKKKNPQISLWFLQFRKAVYPISPTQIKINFFPVPRLFHGKEKGKIRISCLVLGTNTSSIGIRISPHKNQTSNQSKRHRPTDPFQMSDEEAFVRTKIQAQSQLGFN